jgi:hypothetical protein
MNWDAAEAAIRTHIETAWASGSYASIPLVWENEQAADSPSYMVVTIDGVDADKTGYGSTGKRYSVEFGLVIFHCFVPSGWGKAAASAPVRALTQMIELQSISSVIDMDGGWPPSPTDFGDLLTPDGQPGGNYYRVSGRVPFAIRGAL